MVEPNLIHRTKICSIQDILLYQIGPMFAVVQARPEETYWKFFLVSEWPEAISYYKNRVRQEVTEEEYFQRNRGEKVI
jgi:hypothetical protein